MWDTHNLDFGLSHRSKFYTVQNFYIACLIFFGLFLLLFADLFSLDDRTFDAIIRLFQSMMNTGHFDASVLIGTSLSLSLLPFLSLVVSEKTLFGFVGFAATSVTMGIVASAVDDWKQLPFFLMRGGGVLLTGAGGC